MDTSTHELTVACGPREAFELFTTGMGGWWDPAYSPDPTTYTGIDVDPRVGGEVAMLGDGRYVFGHVTTWEPGEAYAQTFWLSMSPAHPTTIAATFAAVDGVCTVRFEHGGWNEQNSGSRYKFGDWPALLGRFAEAAARL